MGGVSVVALIFAGVILIALGVLASGSLPMMALGVLCLVAAGVFEVLGQRRPH